MIAKYNGICKLSGEKIIAGITEIVKLNGGWQIKGAKPGGRGADGKTGFLSKEDMELYIAEAVNQPKRTTPRTKAPGPAGATVVMAWSENDQDRWGDEIARHYWAYGDDDGEVVGYRWECASADSARRMAEVIFEDSMGTLADVIIDVFI